MAMYRTFGIAAGAGLASALLFAASARGAGPALLLAYVTPLPVMIAALGFGQASGLVAAGVGTVGIGLFMGVLPGILYGALLGFPSWLLAFLALLARPLAIQPAGPGPQQPSLLLWYPLGRVVAWGAAVVAAVILLSGGAVLLRYGGYEHALSVMSERIQSILGSDVPENLSGATTARSIVQLLPVLMAASAFLMLMINLWLAARIVQRSGLLTRPWPLIPENLRLPKVVAVAFGLGALATLVEGAPRVAGGVVAAATGMAFVLQGLGTAHALTRGLAARRLILVMIYLITLSVVPSVVALAVLGIVDCLFSLRHRPPPTNPPLREQVNRRSPWK